MLENAGEYNDRYDNDNWMQVLRQGREGVGKVGQLVQIEPYAGNSIIVQDNTPSSLEQVAMRKLIAMGRSAIVGLPRDRSPFNAVVRVTTQTPELKKYYFLVELPNLSRN